MSDLYLMNCLYNSSLVLFLFDIAFNKHCNPFPSPQQVVQRIGILEEPEIVYP